MNEKDMSRFISYRIPRKAFLMLPLALGSLEFSVSCDSEKKEDEKDNIEPLLYEKLWERRELISAAFTNNNIYATNALAGLEEISLDSGQTLWRLNISGKITWIEENNLYLVNEGTVLKVDTQNKEILWERPRIGRFVSLLDNGSLLLGPSTGYSGGVRVTNNAFFIDASNGQFIEEYQGDLREFNNRTVSPVPNSSTRKIDDIEYSINPYTVYVQDRKDPSLPGRIALHYVSISANRILQPSSAH